MGKWRRWIKIPRYVRERDVVITVRKEKERLWCVRVCVFKERDGQEGGEREKRKWRER